MSDEIQVNSNEQNEISLKKKIIVLVATILLITGITFCSWLFSSINNAYVRLILSALLNLTNGAVAFIAIKITKIKIGIELKNFYQYLIGLGIALVLSLFIAFIPAWAGHSIVGSHQDYKFINLLINFLFYMLIIGPVEELIFRVYVQETFISFFNKNKWIGVILASMLFGIWHLINGSFFQVLFTFMIGSVFGFAKYFIKQYKYLGLSFTHGLYDFLNVIVRMFVI